MPTSDAVERLRQSRWRDALHEAGHLVVYWRLTGRTPEFAVIFDPATKSGGLVRHCGMDSPWDDAIVAAAGRSGEALGEVYAPPAEVPTTAIVKESLGVAKTEELRHEGQQSETDERIIALASISGHEGDSRRWENREHRLHHEADLLVRDHAGLTYAVADILFRRGLQFRSELEKLLPPKPIRLEDSDDGAVAAASEENIAASSDADEGKPSGPADEGSR